MTNSFLSSVRRRFLLGALVAAAVAGCGPKDGVKEYESGTAAYGVGNLEKAERLFAKSVLYAPENVDALVMLARVRCDLAEIAAAGQTIARAVALAPNSPDVILLDAEIAYYAKDYSRAIRRFSEVADDKSLGASARALGWAGLGIVEMTRLRRDYARIAFLWAIRLDPRLASARYYLGLLYRGDDFGYLDAALEQFEIFVHLGEKVDAPTQKAQRVIIPAIKADIARRAAERPGVAKRDAAAATAALQRAEAAWKKGRYRDARAEYEKAAAADVLSYPAALGLARAWEKTDLTESGRRKALDCYKTACSLGAGRVSTFITAGDLAMKLNQFVLAEELYSRAVAANPADPTAIDGLIRALRKVGGKAKVADAYQLYREQAVVRRGR